MIDFTNNKIALAILVFTVLSLVSNIYVYTNTYIPITGKVANAVGTVSLCQNYPPTLISNCKRTVPEGAEYFCDITYYDYNCIQSEIFANTTLSRHTTDYDIVNISLRNFGIHNITIYKIKVSWNSSEPYIEKVRINDTDVWNTSGSPSGRQSSGTVLDITNITLDSGSPEIMINKLLFNESIDNKNITLEFYVQSSGSSSSSGTFSVRLVLDDDNITRTYYDDDCNIDETYYDYTGLFDIDPESGEIYFLPPFTFDKRYVGNYTVTLGFDDNSPCSNGYNNFTMDLEIIPNKDPVILSYYPNATTHSTFPQIRINETGSVDFIVRYYDPDRDRINATWHINRTLTRIEENDEVSSYNFTANYRSAGIRTIFVNITDPFNNSVNVSWTLNVSNINRNISLNRSIPNSTWDEDTSNIAYDLDEYFYDPDVAIVDGDSITYTAVFITDPHSITATIDSTTHIVKYSQPQDWYGTEYAYFIAEDSYGSRAVSNNVTLTVRDVPETQSQDSSSSGGGGGGSSGGGYLCNPDWFCSKWSLCYPNGTRYRDCFDLNNCHTRRNMPLLEENCTYIPECYDGIQNQEEEGVDCGGPCPPCGTCYDKIKNNGEYGVDCGGPCDPCPSCFDGIMNDGETGVDCGGPCDPCPTCNDGIKNGNEKDVDCGGPCPPCKYIEAPAFVIGISVKEKVVVLAVLLAILAVVVIFLAYNIIKIYWKDIKNKTLTIRSVLSGKRDNERPLTDDQILKNSTLRRISNIESRMSNEDPEKTLSSIFSITKDFFKSALKLDSELTHEEIHKEIIKRNVSDELRSRIEYYVNKLERINYSKDKPTLSELDNLIRLLKEIVDVSVDTEKKIVLGENIELKRIKELISITNDAIQRNDAVQAEEVYKKALEIYEFMDDALKSEVYGRISSLYKKISSMKKKQK